VGKFGGTTREARSDHILVPLFETASVSLEVKLRSQVFGLTSTYACRS
jgi:hypothetical protein